jgi:hypothetical protein
MPWLAPAWTACGYVFIHGQQDRLGCGEIGFDDLDGGQTGEKWHPVVNDQNVR